MKHLRTLTDATFALLVVAGLGFGADQALASDAPAEARACVEWECEMECVLGGYNYGICNNGDCECWYF